VTFYADMAVLAADLLQDFGEDGFIRRSELLGGGGPSDLDGGAERTRDYACRVAVLPIDQRDVDGALIKAGDWRAYVALLSIVPTTTDRLVCSAGVLTIVDPGQMAPAGTTTHYEMIVRRA